MNSATNRRPCRPYISSGPWAFADFSQAVPPTTGHRIGETYWCGYWQQYYVVLGSVAYSVGDRIIPSDLRNVVVLWDCDDRHIQPDGEIGVHHTQVDGDDLCTVAQPEAQADAEAAELLDRVLGPAL